MWSIDHWHPPKLCLINRSIINAENGNVNPKNYSVKPLYKNNDIGILRALDNNTCKLNNVNYQRIAYLLNKTKSTLNKAVRWSSGHNIFWKNAMRCDCRLVSHNTTSTDTNNVCKGKLVTLCMSEYITEFCLTTGQTASTLLYKKKSPKEKSIAVMTSF